jgi:uncharacterized protein DUF4873
MTGSGSADGFASGRTVGEPSDRPSGRKTVSRGAEETGYRGALTVRVDGAQVEIDGELHGFFQPIDGSFHWHGRLAPDERISTLVAERGRATIEISVADRDPVPARLGERNPWGGHRVTGTGPPPYA